MESMNTEKVCNILNEIMEYELAGVVRYTHSAMMVSGPYRLPIVQFLKEQATESLIHAQQAGVLLWVWTVILVKRLRRLKRPIVTQSKIFLKKVLGMNFMQLVFTRNF